MGERDGWRLIWAVYGVQAVVTTRRKQSKEAKKLAATRRHMKKSRAIAMLGFALEAVAVGRAVLRLDTRSRHKQLNNVVHGGILAAMADTASAIAAYTTVPAGVALATVEMTINYLEGVPGGRIRAEGRVLRTGRNFVVTECEIFDSKGTLAAKALLTFGAAGGHSLQK
jgi:uncharacterized protein (TIGR00369 family)